MSFCLVYVTFPSKKEAVQIVSMIVREKLAACANIIDSITSIYCWNEKIQKDSECIVLKKKKKKKFKEIEQKILKFHSYETPCILKLEITDGNKSYLSWLHANCK